VTVADDDAGSAATEMTALVTGAGLTPQGLLGVVGTDYLDVVGIQKKFKRDIVVNAGFLGPGKADFVESDVASIEVRVCDGNDQIHVGGDIAKPAILDGGPGPDHIRAGSGVSMVLGGWGNDTLFAGRFGSILFGGPGDDDLNGNKGDDMLFGEEGDDKLAGDKGNDELDGGPGLDDCNPGKGSDVVVNCESSGLAPGGPHSGTRPSGRPAAGSAAPPRSRGPHR
jgi:Ca2+-binding RTX toxin-like protein